MNVVGDQAPHALTQHGKASARTPSKVSAEPTGVSMGGCILAHQTPAEPRWADSDRCCYKELGTAMAGARHPPRKAAPPNGRPSGQVTLPATRTLKLKKNTVRQHITLDEGLVLLALWCRGMTMLAGLSNKGTFSRPGDMEIALAIRQC